MPKKIVISGSFRHLPQLESAAIAFTQAGHSVLAPVAYRASGKWAGFVRLPTDAEQTKNRRVETNFMRTLRQADFHYVVIPKGRIGHSVAAEIAYAALLRKPVIVSRRPVRLAKEIARRERRLILQKISAVIPVGKIARIKSTRIKPRRVRKSERAVLKGVLRKLLKTL